MHVYSIQISNDSNTSHHNPNDYLLSVEYDTKVYKLYSMVVDHYKTFADYTVLMVNDYKIVCGAAALHVLFYPPIICYRHPVYISVQATIWCIDFSKCHNPIQCELAKKVNDDLIIRNMDSVHEKLLSKCLLIK